MSISKLTTASGYAATVLLVSVASTPVAEFGFRLIGDAPSFDLQGLYAPFGEGNYKYGAWVDTDAYLASGHISAHTDGLGLRCDKGRRFGTKQGDSVDVLVIGDSQGFGNGVNFEETIAGSMAGAAAAEGYRVANASVGGHSLASQLELARLLVDQRNLKVASFVLFLTPAMIHECDRLNHATVGPDGRLYGSDPDFMTRLRLWTRTHVVVYSRIRDAIRNCGIGADPAKGSAAVFEFYKPGAEEVEARERLLGELKKFREFASNHGAAMRLVYVPLTVEANFASVKEAAAKCDLTLDPDTPFRICASVAEVLTLPLHDLRPVLARIHSEGHPLNVMGDFHYSALLSVACGTKLWGELSLRTRVSGITSTSAKN